MTNMFDFNFVWSILGALAKIIVFGICGYFVIVKPCTESILLSIGSFIQMFVSLFYSVGVMILARMYGIGSFGNSGMYSIMGGVGFIGTICFTAGLIVLIINYVRIIKHMKLEKY